MALDNACTAFLLLRDVGTTLSCPLVETVLLDYLRLGLLLIFLTVGFLNHLGHAEDVLRALELFVDGIKVVGEEPLIEEAVLSIEQVFIVSLSDQDLGHLKRRFLPGEQALWLVKRQGHARSLLGSSKLSASEAEAGLDRVPAVL